MQCALIDDVYMYSDDTLQQSVSPNVESLPVLTVDSEPDCTETQSSLQTEPGLETIPGGDIKSEFASHASLTSYQHVNTRDSQSIVGLEQRYLFTSLHGQQKQDSFECFLHSALSATDSGSMTEREGELSTLSDNKYHRMAFDRLK